MARLTDYSNTRFAKPFWCKRPFLIGLSFLALAMLALAHVKWHGQEDGQQAVADRTDNLPCEQKTRHGNNVTANSSLPGSMAMDKIQSAKNEEPGGSETSSIANANALLAFYNKAANALSGNWYCVPDTIAANLAAYPETWQLPPLPSLQDRTKSSQTLLAGINLPCLKGKNLEKHVSDMDAAIYSMLADYRAFETYAADMNIRDDGRRGKGYIRGIEKSIKKFTAARSAWLEIVGHEVETAEALLLQGHPLANHSILAKKIFNLFATSAKALGADKPDRKQLHLVKEQLAQCLEEAGRLSFAAGPQYERHYRNFLSAANRFANLLDEGIATGFYRPLRIKLNQEIGNCRKAYNAFAEMSGSLATVDKDQ